MKKSCAYKASVYGTFAIIQNLIQSIADYLSHSLTKIDQNQKLTFLENITTVKKLW